MPPIKRWPDDSPPRRTEPIGQADSCILCGRRINGSQGPSRDSMNTCCNGARVCLPCESAIKRQAVSRFIPYIY